MMPYLHADDLASALAAGVGGLAFGVVYFAALRRSVALFVAHAGWSAPAALAAGRLTAALLLFALLARLGAAAPISAMCGLLLARGLALRAARKGN